MKERPYRGVVRQQCAEVDQFGPLRFGIESGAHRMLHERIRRDDEERRGVHPERDDPDAGQVDQSRQPAPAEDPQPEERRLEEERDQAFERQWRAEDVADEAGVLAPVHAELEFLHDSGGHADREVDQEQLPEELASAGTTPVLPVTTQAVCIAAMSGARPMVSGTKMKW